jgi:alpha-tubulin suppressor-like RCC1 family protein
MNRLARLLSALAIAALVGLSAPLPASAAPDTSLGVLKVSAGGYPGFTCAILSDQSLWCWGVNYYGQLGDPALSRSEPALLPNKVTGNHLWATLDIGAANVCAIDTDGALWCWGANFYGELGIGSEDYNVHATPTRVGTDSNWVGVTNLTEHACAIKSTGTIWCWGYGDSRLGLGITPGNQTSPTQVGSDNAWGSIDAGFAHTCATKLNGTLWCWGHLDDSNYSNEVNTPTQIGASNQNGWVGAGTAAACTITTTATHTLSCYGANAYGQGGNNSTSRLNDLTPVSGGGSWISAGLGDRHACGVQSTNTLWCWGSNTNGQLANADYTDSLVPTAAVTSLSWTAVDSGPLHSCAITTGRDLYCWGDNSTGQVGDGTQTTRNVPVLVIDGAELPATNADTPAQRAQVLAQLALLAAVCAFAVRMSASIVDSKGSRRR